MVSIYHVLALGIIVALIQFLGPSFVAEKIHGLFQMVFGRSAYAAYIRDWQELRKTKQELATISAQDEFARWARLQRKIDTMQANFDKLHSSRKRQAMMVEFGLSVVVRGFMYVSLFWVGLWQGRSQLVEGMSVPVELFGPLSGYFAYPSGKVGEVSVPVFLTLAIVATKHLLESLTTA